MIRRAFTVVELLVVIGIISVLIGLLVPAVSRSREQARAVACRSNLRQVGVLLAAYAAENNGVVVPYGVGGVCPLGNLWIHMILPDPGGHEILTCPTAEAARPHEHSYLINDAIWPAGLWPAHSARSASETIVVGENRPGSNLTEGGERGPGGPTYDPARHGPTLGSNALYLDYHVDNDPPTRREDGTTPWWPWR